ncbi:MAG TPA: inositol monophosphatase family protein [Actinomycetes bacterium]|nr:inositol monophosphatase family protein [Actinomycetes bacterium]
MDNLAPDCAQLRALCVTAAEAAAALVSDMRERDDVDVTATKSSPTDVVTNADAAAEKLLRAELLGARPGDGWLGEETGATSTADGDGRVRWIVDPIDGTVNYLYGLPGWAVSVAAEVAGVVVAGAVVAPTLRQTFSAELGGGATCNGRPIAVSVQPRLDQALVATGFAYRASVRARQGAAIGQLLPLVRDIRRAGAAAVDFCALASGRVDAYFERGTSPWDRASGALIAREAGAVVIEDDEGGVVAAGPVLIEALQAALRKVGA